MIFIADKDKLSYNLGRWVCMVCGFMVKLGILQIIPAKYNHLGEVFHSTGKWNFQDSPLHSL